LRAIRSALAAARPDIQVAVTVIDNHSPEGVVSAVRGAFGESVQVRINERNVGIIENWNRARAAGQDSGADFWMLLEDDNFLEPTFLEATVGVAQADPSLDLVYTACTEFDDHGNKSIWTPWSVRGGRLGGGRVEPAERLAWAYTCAIKISGMIVRNTSALRGLPEFYEEFGPALDLTGLSRLALEARGLAFLPDPLMSYYVNPRSLSAMSRVDARWALSELLRSLRKNIALLVSAGTFDLAEWRSASKHAPIDRLMAARLAVDLPGASDVGSVRAVMSEVLSSRSDELRGWKGWMARLLGPSFWSLAGIQARRAAKRLRGEIRTADFDSDAC
jgi:hypothetical protein